MMEEIAVCMDANGYTVGLDQAGSIIVYQRIDEQWQQNRSLDFAIDQVQDLKELRWQMQKLVKYLGECRIFVALRISGVPYYELEKSRISVWEIPGRAEEFLDEVWKREHEPSAPPDSEALNTAPQLIETFPGCFRISLVEVQSSHSMLTTKQVLLPILRQGGFRALEVLCNHLPPWFEQELENGKYQSHVERSKGETKVLIQSRME